MREESDVSEKLLTPNFPVDNNKKKAKTILTDFLNIHNSGGPVLTGRGEEQTLVSFVGDQSGIVKNIVSLGG